MAIQSTQEFILEVDTESSLGSASTSNAKTWMVDETPTMLGKTWQIAPSAVRGFVHPLNNHAFKEYNGLFESALTLPMRIRQSYSSDGVTQLTRTAESCGCNIGNFVNTTISDATPAVDEVTLAADVCEEGQVAGFTVTGSLNGVMPMLIAANSTGTVTPLFDLPAAPANSSDVYNCTTITPRVRQVPATKTLNMNFVQNNYGGADAESEKYYGCACSSLGTFELAPNTIPMLSPTYHVTGVTNNHAHATVSEAFLDDSGLSVFGDNFDVVLYGGYSSIGGITPTYLDIISVSLSFGVSTVPIIGAGAGARNGVQGFMAVVNRDDIRLTVKLPVKDDGDVEDLITSSSISSPSVYQSWKSWGFCKMGSNAGMPNIGLYLPKCGLIDIEQDRLSESYRIATLTYQVVNAGLNSISDPSDSGDQPWYLGILNPKAS